ncbi:HAD family hydrolase [Vibrio nitrifigilis]|uniref:HAD-IA family hydrolase n=1 Tax=Vibrio nitrifigilis TaxID=2789781 RepID=A0ABS0GKI0_9VIBR|nr:HAD-IA family hydrolase [Vibrio nitrifigilis]MBF9002943.1 HAD-IA family hydrolase [Vibrio nitrifigilis]
MKLVIFDCDGTLVDSELLCNLGLEHQLAELGIQCKAEDLVQRFRGGKLANILANLEQEFSTSFPASFEQQYRAKVDKLFDQHLIPCDGVVDLLESLTVPFCIASSAPRTKIERALQVTGLSHYFTECIFSSYEVGSWKPEPDLFLHAAKSMQVKPQDCCVLEDSYLGIEAANRANMVSVYYAPNMGEKYPKASVQIAHMSEFNHKMAQHESP